MRLITSKEETALNDKISRFEEVIQQLGDNENVFKERLAELELSLEDRDWNKLSSESNAEFSRDALDRINQLARLYWLKNPLIKRAVAVQTSYVFGQGLEISSTNNLVNEVIQDFLDDPKNKTELTDHQNKAIKETELQLFANVFFAIFTDKLTGLVRVRTIPMGQIKEIICNPEDSKEPWYYKRTYVTNSKSKTVYYKDWKAPEKETRPGLEDALIYHVAVNKLSDMKFGVSEVYAAIDWSKAYKEFLEDWSTIVKAYSRFAWNLTAKNKTGVLNAKAKLNTTLNSTNRETNPPPVAGSTFIGTDNTKLEPIKTSGATTSAEDGDKLIHMVSAATGIYYHYLIGDPSTGNLATAKSMERPMELMFRERQELWTSVYTNLINYVVDQSIKAPRGKLKGKTTVNIYGEKVHVLQGDEQRELNITFPDMFEKDVVQRVDAIIKAATMDGKQFAGTIEPKVAARLLLAALGEHDIDEMIDQLFPDGEETENVVNQAMEEVRDFLSDLKLKLDKIK